MEKIKIWVAAGLIVGSSNANAIIFNIDYSLDSNNFFSDQVRRDVFEAAAGFYESRISDNLLAINSSGSNQFNAKFFRPDTGVSETLNGFDVAADTLTVFVGGRSLGGSTLGVGGSGGYGLSASSTAFADNAVSRGQGDGTQASVEGPGAFDFATWGGAISFDTQSNWYFDDNVNTDENFSGFDFFSVALHEIGHLLGFGIADSWNNQIIAGTFTGSESEASFGGPVALNGGLDHWADGTSSGGQETNFDPTISNGVRKRVTDLDLAALRDIGWQVSVTPVPVPGAVWLFGSALLCLLKMSRRRNISA
ncbi:matrixin family metalloprotease [Methylomonas methanica]|uniref:Peptidase M10A and M12B matrixin and adamalysin n=1 Tax=Methylomonas methanica (strain DSM 25384 / MC09) TaxID=857087 RepID=F9ZYV5_METMM|nr:matrixin family metalloprotease [Methylomonas methanica]AEF98651.1 peptidase M10A and M12B matrixin and adamalysin [Methylomonas methanica MC09]